MPNRLAQEKSPYLLQHAENPVDWFAWGPEAFAKARAEDKPIFLSIGYSTCHWCHVMERESFEKQAIAELLNRDYVSIKLDREERPDIDRVYMTFVQATTGSGGWPMSVFLTPDLEPFYGGTYFPPENRWGTPGFASVLSQIAAAWKNDRARLEEAARDVVERLKQQGSLDAGQKRAGEIDAALMENAFRVFERTFDARTGGFGGAPKFPRPSVFSFLHRYHARTKDADALGMSLLTLREMSHGGMNDQLGGGFHRYSVDDRWFVPHFEKMLYDQAQLAMAYIEAFQITGDQQYADTARRTLDYVLRDMTAPEGGFYSAEDADSVIDPAHPHEKGEGAFYIWRAAEIRELLGALAGPAADWFMYRYGASEEGNVAHDPHEEFTGRNILFQSRTVEQVARKFDATESEVQAALDAARPILLEARAKRVRPHLDDKVLTAWNGLMISAFAKAGAALGEARYADAARRAAGFAIGKMYDPGSRTLLRRYRAGDAAIGGFLDDYSFFAQALLDLYEAQFDLDHLELALELIEETTKRFGDQAGSGFYSTAEGDASAILRMKDDYDGAEPSGNSVAAMNLLRAAQLANNAAQQEQADALLRAFHQRLSLAPASLPQMLAACEFVLSRPRQIVVVSEGAGGGAGELLRAAQARFVPGALVISIDSARARAFFAKGIPAVEGMSLAGERAAAYVCRDSTCQLPVSDVADLTPLLQ